MGATVVFVTVHSPLHSMDHEPSVADDMPEESKKFVHEFLTAGNETSLEAASSVARRAGVTFEALKVEHEHVYQGIIDTAESTQCGLIVMASHGRRGVSAIILGSETSKVLTHSKIPVLVYR